MSNAHHMLTRRLHAYFGAHGLAPQLRASRSERWASATFSGARHHFDFALDDGGQGARDSLGQAGTAISDADFRLPGHILADIGLVTFGETATCFAIEALTVEAA